jgi:flagellar basal-body rod protein FlgB
MIISIDQFGSMLNNIAQQQKIISNNVSNAQTPGYIREKVDFKSVMGQLDNPFQTALGQKMGSNADKLIVSTGDPEDQGVDLAQEMLDMQKVFLNYSIVSRRATSVFNNLRRATQIGK